MRYKSQNKQGVLKSRSKIRLLTVVVLCSAAPAFAQGGNLLDSSSWTEGTGSIGVFNQFGTDANTLREIGTDPYGNETVIWNAIGPVSSNSESGGWTSDMITISDNTKSYRFTVWVMKKGVLDINGAGKTVFGFQAQQYPYGGLNVKNLDGSQPSNGHFFFGTLPELDKWYLMVGFIHGKNHSSQVVEGKIYDAATGEPVAPMPYEFKFGQNTNRISSKYLLFGEYYNTASQLQWNPSIYETTDPQMPSVESLLAPSIAAAASGGGLWSANTNGIHFNSGNVGIGTADPGTDWKLAVNGKIRSKEIKVETGWADYVFEENYPLPTLEEVQKHITEKGHLMNIPPAAEVEANGIELGEMNRLLLEKIEEMTLYILQQHRINQLQEQKLKAIQYRLKQLDTLKQD